MWKSIVVLLLLTIPSTSFAKFDFFDTAANKIKSIEAVNNSAKKEKLFRTTVKQLVGKKQTGYGPSYRAWSALVEVSKMLPNSKMNKQSCNKLYTKISMAFHPNRSIASAPNYLMPAMALVDSVCFKRKRRK